MRTESPRSSGPGFGWWAVPLVAAVVLVNLAGIWEITNVLRTLRRQEEHQLRLSTAARAAGLESLISGTTVDLAFVANARSLLGADVSSGGDWRNEAGLALLLFLRGHLLIDSIVVRDADGIPLLEAGRPRGIPGFWIPDPGQPAEGAVRPFRRRFNLPSRHAVDRPASLEATLDPAVLATQILASDDLERAQCSLLDASGESLLEASTGPSGAAAVEHAVGDAGWAADGPWRLRCWRSATSPGAVLEPLVARQRSAIAVNLVVMILAVGLGVFAFRQQRKARDFEDRARREARVRELERQLFHAERLSTVGRLAAGMAHEINNPLEGVSNYLRLAVDAVEQEDPERALRSLRGVRQGMERAAAIVRRVLDHSDPAAPVTEVIDLRDVVTEASDFVRSRQEFQEIRFEVDLPDTPLHVRANGVMLGQVFLNLILNACEAQPEGGEVLIRGVRDSGRAQVDVADLGPGVPEARRDRLFEPFESTKSSAGLGLSICHSIMKRHDGELTFHERDRGGALFRVTLDAIDAEDHDGAP